MKKPMIPIREDFTQKDLDREEYYHALQKAADRIHRHNLQLMERLKDPNVDLANEFDASANTGAANIHYLCEQVALYREGAVPWQVVVDCYRSTLQLGREMMKLNGAPIEELDYYLYVVREFFGRWMLTYHGERMDRRDYLKVLFRLQDKVLDALRQSHHQYVINAAQGKLTQRREKAPARWDKDELFIFPKLRAAVKKGAKARPTLDTWMRGTYKSRMSGRKLVTWLRNYYAWRKESNNV